MALSKNITHKGVPIKNAYLRISTLHIFQLLEGIELPDKDENGNVQIEQVWKWKMGISVETSADRDAAECLGSEPNKFICDYDLESKDNAVTQAYKYLRSLDEFSDATDIIDTDGFIKRMFRKFFK